MARYAKETLGLPVPDRVGFVHNPEFLRATRALDDVVKPFRVVIGGIDERSSSYVANLFREFYSRVGYEPPIRAARWRDDRRVAAEGRRPARIPGHHAVRDGAGLQRYAQPAGREPAPAPVDGLSAAGPGSCPGHPGPAGHALVANGAAGRFCPPAVPGAGAGHDPAGDLVAGGPPKPG